MADSSGGEQDRRRKKKKVKRGEGEGKFHPKIIMMTTQKGARGDGLLSHTLISNSIARLPCSVLIILTCIYIAHMHRHKISINEVK